MSFKDPTGLLSYPRLGWVLTQIRDAALLTLSDVVADSGWGTSLTSPLFNIAAAVPLNLRESWGGKIMFEGTTIKQPATDQYMKVFDINILGNDDGLNTKQRRWNEEVANGER